MLDIAIQCVDTQRMITKKQARELFGSVKELQAALGLKSHATISMWGSDDSPIPAIHDLRIRYVLKPESFDAKGRLIAKRKAA